MNLAVLRVEGDDQILDALCAALWLDVDSRWKKGEARRKGTHATSGICMTIADAETPAEMVQAIRKFLFESKDKGIAFSCPDISAAISIGVTVGDSVQFVACLDFSAADLWQLASLGIALHFCAYPTSDEANAGPEN